MSLKTAMFFSMGYPLEAETKAILSRAALEGIAVPSIVQREINKAIVSLKAEGLWALIDFFLMMGYNNLALEVLALINWKNPAGDLAVKYGGLTYTLSGFEANGVDGYIDTRHNPVLNPGAMKLANAHVSSVVYKAGAVSTVLGNSVSYTVLSNSASLTQRLNVNSNLVGAMINLTGLGLIALTRDNNTQVTGYYKTTATTANSGVTSLFNTPYWLFRRTSTYGSVGASSLTTGGHLTAANVAKLREIQNNFFEGLGLPKIA